MKRRDFLRGSSSVVVSSVAGAYGARAYSRVNSSLANMLNYANETDRVLVMVFMNGGNDGLNTIIPLSELSKLSAARPQVFLPENKLIKLPGTDLAMHPSMSDFKELYDEEKLLVVQNVGYENPVFSHFRSTDIWMSASDSHELITNGWTGRYLDQQYPNYPFDYPNANAPHPLAIEIGRSSSLIFQGPSASMGMAIHDPTFFYDLIDNIPASVPDGPIGERIELIRILAKQSEQYSSRVKEAAERVTQQSSYPSYDLADQLKIVARLVAGGLQTRLYMVELRRFDTHADQVDRSDPTKGTHSDLLRQLGSSIKAFVKDCESLGISDRVMGMTFSEFGRRIKSNASYGTDHGAAAPLFFFGNNINSGVIGKNPKIPDEIQVRSNLEHEFEFRQIYSTMFRDWFCMSEGDVQGILGDFSTLDVVKPEMICDASTTSQNDLKVKQSRLQIYPTLAHHEVTIELVNQTEDVTLTIVGMDGRVHKTIAGAGINGTPIRVDVTDLVPGQYYVRYVDRQHVESEAFVVQ